MKDLQSNSPLLPKELHWSISTTSWQKAWRLTSKWLIITWGGQPCFLVVITQSESQTFQPLKHYSQGLNNSKRKTSPCLTKFSSCRLRVEQVTAVVSVVVACQVAVLQFCPARVKVKKRLVPMVRLSKREETLANAKTLKLNSSLWVFLVRSWKTPSIKTSYFSCRATVKSCLHNVEKNTKISTIGMTGLPIT